MENKERPKLIHDSAVGSLIPGDISGEVGEGEVNGEQLVSGPRMVLDSSIEAQREEECGSFLLRNHEVELEGDELERLRRWRR